MKKAEQIIRAIFVCSCVGFGATIITLIVLICMYGGHSKAPFWFLCMATPSITTLILTIYPAMSGLQTVRDTFKNISEFIKNGI